MKSQGNISLQLKVWTSSCLNDAKAIDQNADFLIILSWREIWWFINFLILLVFYFRKGFE